ncbi:MAG: DUF5906 domain-containing protein [Cyclobacteriaceae bacterium]
MSNKITISQVGKSAKTYCDERLEALGITPEINSFELVRPSRTKPGEEIRKVVKFFEPDKYNNISIHYFKLDHTRVRFPRPDAKGSNDFIRKRLFKPSDNRKYSQPKGSAHHPFFPPGILNKFRLAQKIEALYVIEGEFKAFKGCMYGLDIVGIPSIHGFYSGKFNQEMHPKELHSQLAELILVCQVKKLVYLTDADTLSVNWKEGKDLSKRPTIFYNAIVSFRQSLEPLLDNQDCQLKKIYFMHLDSRFIDDAKGLDDLLSKYTGLNPQREIREDLEKFAFANQYFRGHDITNGKLTGLDRYFGLTNVTDFYNKYEKFIGDNEFVFKRIKYQYIASEGRVKRLRHEDADLFMRIGADWYKIIKKNDKYGEPQLVLIPFRVGEIARDYKKHPDFLESIPKYDSFCNEPDCSENYKQVHLNNYNIFSQLKHEINAGEFPHISKFLKHIFQGSADINNNIESDQFTVALDYLTLMYQMPKQMLPVLILVSPENGTGKSTFLKWLKAIYTTNMVILGNEQFNTKFNAHFISKFIIAIDEGFLELEKKAEKERIKMLATADTVHLENKGVDQKEIPYYGKLMICSNDADRVLKVDEGETRWFVVRVPVIPKENRDPDLEHRMKKEIPAWLHFLKHRKVFHKKKDRLWFSPEQFETDQLRKIQETTKNRLDRVFEYWLKEQFLLFKLPVLKYHMTHLVETLNNSKTSKYKIDEIDLKAYLKEKKGIFPDKLNKINIPLCYQNIEGVLPGESPQITFLKTTQRAYIFRYQDWLTEEEILEFNEPFDWSDTEVQDMIKAPF